MAKKKTTNLYINIEVELDEWIDNIRKEYVKREKRHYTKSEVAKVLIKKGKDVEEGIYFKLNPKLDSILEQFTHQKMNVKGKVIEIDKPKIQVIEDMLYSYLQSLGEK